MRKRSTTAVPASPSEDRETVRRRIRALLEEGPHTAKEISFAIPGRCPVCRGESISDPSFRVEGA